MRDCPDCKTPVDGLRCPICGRCEEGYDPVDRTRYLCANEYRGQRCARLGVFSYSTLGSDTWFCAEHFVPTRAPEGSMHRPLGPRPLEAVVERMAMQDRL